MFFKAFGIALTILLGCFYEISQPFYWWCLPASFVCWCAPACDVLPTCGMRGSPKTEIQMTWNTGQNKKEEHKMNRKGESLIHIHNINLYFSTSRKNTVLLESVTFCSLLPSAVSLGFSRKPVSNICKWSGGEGGELRSVLTGQELILGITSILGEMQGLLFSTGLSATPDKENSGDQLSLISHYKQ